MNKRFVVVMMLAVAMGGAWLQARQAPGQQPSRLTLEKIRNNMFVVRNEFVPGNVTALVTNEGVILVDDKFEIDIDNVLAQLKTVTDQPVRYVINTHHHGDHSGGNARMQALGAQVVASAQARRHMVAANQPGQPTITFDDAIQLHLGGETVELYHFGRAHTDGDVFVYFPRQRVLATGDAFTFGSATPQLIDYQGGGSAKAWPVTLTRALALDFDTVVPGHGAVTTKAELAKFRDATDAMQRRVRQMLRERRTAEEITAVLKQEFDGAQLVFPGLLDGLLIELR